MLDVGVCTCGNTAQGVVSLDEIRAKCPLAWVRVKLSHGWHGGTTAERFPCIDIDQAVIGAYLDAKRAREWPRLQRGTNRAEYMYSRLDIRYYNHLMHKLESLSRGVACIPERRATWTQVLQFCTPHCRCDPPRTGVSSCIKRRCQRALPLSVAS